MSVVCNPWALVDLSTTGESKIHVAKKDFKICKVIGRGAYGKVFLVNYLPTGEFYAMKSIKKEVVLTSDQVDGMKGKTLIFLSCVV